MRILLLKYPSSVCLAAPFQSVRFTWAEIVHGSRDADDVYETKLSVNLGFLHILSPDVGLCPVSATCRTDQPFLFAIMNRILLSDNPPSSFSSSQFVPFAGL